MADSLADGVPADARRHLASTASERATHPAAAGSSSTLRSRWYHDGCIARAAHRNRIYGQVSTTESTVPFLLGHKRRVTTRVRAHRVRGKYRGGREKGSYRGEFARYLRSGHSRRESWDRRWEEEEEDEGDVGAGRTARRPVLGLPGAGKNSIRSSNCLAHVSRFLSLSLSFFFRSRTFFFFFFHRQRSIRSDRRRRARELARSRDAFTLEPGKCQAQQGALTAIDVVCRELRFFLRSEINVPIFRRDSGHGDCQTARSMTVMPIARAPFSRKVRNS